MLRHPAKVVRMTFNKLNAQALCLQVVTHGSDCAGLDGLHVHSFTSVLVEGCERFDSNMGVLFYTLAVSCVPGAFNAWFAR